MLTKKLKCGAPHFISTVRQIRSSGYTFIKALYENVDNCCRKAKNISINIRVNEYGKIVSYQISDDIEGGFENINKEGSENPFNFGHIRSGQYDDGDSGMYGIGMKSSAVYAGNKLTVLTKTANGEFKRVVADFIKMQKEINVDESFNPCIFDISADEYYSEHPFECGSTVIVSEINSERVYETTTEEGLTNYLIKKLGYTYFRYINNGLNIEVNSIKVTCSNLDSFNDVKCIPFVINRSIISLEDKNKNKKIFIKKSGGRFNTTYKRYDHDTSKLIQCTEKDIDEAKKNGFNTTNPIPNYDDMSCIIVETTFVFYSDNYHKTDKNDTEDNDLSNEENELPKDKVEMIFNDRIMGDMPIETTVNGSHNYTIHRVTINSKEVAKELGLTFNKDFHRINNNLTNILKEIIKENKNEFSADTSTKKNQALCDYAIDNGIIDKDTCPSGKLYKKYREIREEQEELASQKAAKELADQKISKKQNKKQNKKLKVAETYCQDNHHQGENLIVEVEDKPEDKSEDILEDKPEDKPEDKEPEDKEPEDKPDDNFEFKELEVNVEDTLEDKDIFVVEDKKETNVEEIIIQNAVENLKNMKPNIVTVKETKKLTLSVKDGLKILKEWHESKLNSDLFKEILDDMIIKYQDNCSEIQSKSYLMFMDLISKYELIIYLISNKYKTEFNDSQDMLMGSELYKKYSIINSKN